MKVIISLLMLCALPAFADHHTGFKSGNDISIVTLRGTVYMTCYTPMPPAWATFYCWDALANPGFSDKFVLSEPVDADKVTLSVTKKNGKIIKKTEKYNAKKNESGDFNLLIDTVFQNPLLELGSNEVSYSMMKKGKEVARGTFIATAAVTEERECRPRSLYGSYSDCTSQAAACNYYFYSENDCQY